MVAIILLSGIVLGSMVWYGTVDVGIDYERPTETDDVDIYMSQRETGDYDWYEVEVGQEHELDANFSESDPWTKYHQYVNVSSPENTTVTINIERPHETFGFIVEEGIVEPDDEYADGQTVWDNVTIDDADGNYTVIYHIAPENDFDEYGDVVWNFHVE